MIKIEWLEILSMTVGVFFLTLAICGALLLVMWLGQILGVLI